MGGLIMKTFDWEEFVSGNFAVHFKTEKECNDFLRIAEKYKIGWGSHDPLIEKNYFYENTTDTCYRIDFDGSMRYASVMYYIEDGNTILEWSDYMEFTKEYLNVGMLVEVKDCGKALVMPSKKCGNILLFRDSQFAEIGRVFYKIVKVWDLPTTLSEVVNFDARNRELIYERPTTKEMTVEEVSKALGYDVKIVKG
ncbi:hypothetical protein [Chryseobacterium sp.]|uniref:hypothetical protein n=1 Tax=Chryseobacterium sp. TaxID=1871047 RepID=UPI002FC98DD5